MCLLAGLVLLGGDTLIGDTYV